MPDPIKPDLWGAQSLVQFPDARVLLVEGRANFDAAQRLFHANPVLGWDGKLDDHYLGKLSGRSAIVWLANPLPGHVARIPQLPAADVAVFSPDDPTECWPLAEVEKRHFPKQWMLARIKPVARASSEPREAAQVNGHATVPLSAETRPAPPSKAKKAKRQIVHRTENTPWQDFGLVLNDKGCPVASLQNAVSVLEHMPGLAGNVWFDVFLQRMLHQWGTDTPREWSDYDDVRLALFFQREVGIPGATKFLAHDAVVAYGMREQRNCAYDWLDGLQWDHQPRLWELANKGFGTPKNQYEGAVCRNLILSMVKRVYEPGCKSDYMPIFEGSQGAGKSKALAILGGEWFAECHESIMSKDFFSVLQGKLLIEISEMHAFRQSEVERVKGIVSCPSDRYREPYGRNAIDHPRQGAFAGTTNRDDWNRDETGARRFWPVKCGKIDHAWIRDNREQLFAEAVHCIRDMDEAHWEVPWDVAKAEQDERQFCDTWEETVREWLIGRGATVFLGDVLKDAVGIEPGKQSLGDQQRMGRVMKKLGWEKKVRKTPQGQRKVWISPDADTQPDAASLFED